MKVGKDTAQVQAIKEEIERKIPEASTSVIVNKKVIRSRSSSNGTKQYRA